MVIPTPLLMMLSPIVVFLLGFLGEEMKIEKLREGAAVVMSAVSVAAVYMLYLMLKSTPDGILLFHLQAAPPLGACFEIDMLGILMAFSVTLLTFFATLYSVKYMEHDTRLTEFYTLLAAMSVGMMGVAFAGDLFTLFVFWELMCIASYVLVAFRKDLWGPIEAGFKYFVMSALGAAVIFFAMAFLYGMAGTVNFAQLSDALRGQPLNMWLYMVFGMLVVGFGIKSAIVPMHTWLPDAHPEAPSPISALLSGVVIATGLYGLTRVLFLTFDPGMFKLPIAFLAVLTMTLGNVMALRQSDIKRLLAYSSIAQIGYMLVGLAAGTAYGVMGLFLHVFNHSIMKGMAFLASGSIAHETGTRDIKSLRGVGKMMPLTSLCLFIALLGLGGVPGTNGFISKYHLFSAAFGSGLGWLGIMGVLNSALSMAYYLRIMQVLLASPDEGFKAKEAPVLMVAVTLVMAVLIVFLGVWPAPIIGFATAASEALVNGLSTFIGAVLG
ncbi:MAG: proton-conducting transporter membrane subunit [Candidatus Bathyarchaeota archaeon]|nr:proton-conducting transporter membrane subunit [Candidatus Bathyarchaeota archaeon]